MELSGFFIWSIFWAPRFSAEIKGPSILMPATREMAGSGASIRSEAVLKISSSFSGGSVMEVGQNVVMPQDFK